jgi:GTP pyrophosphokinase
MTITTLLDYLTESAFAHPLVRQAQDFAEKKHEGQMRKDGTPYITHPKRVAKHVYKNKDSHQLPSLMAAAYLHDTKEDCNVEISEIRERFGDLVASLVEELTTDEEEKIKLGKTSYLTKKMLKMSDWGLVIKLCDRLDNVSDLHTSAPEFREKYVKETNDIIRALRKDRRLTRTQIKLINKIQKKIYKLEDKQ